MKLKESYYQRNKEKCKTQSRKYKAKNKEKIRESARQYYHKNKEKYKQYKKNYWQQIKHKHKDKRKDYKYKWKYGVALADYKNMYILQQGCCAICKKHYKVLCIDHCHISGKIRKLLCKRCNTAIGLLYDDAQLLEIAYLYLKEYNETTT